MSYPVGTVEPMAKVAAIYCRISEDRAGNAAGVQRQGADCRALAERRGWSVGEVFVDNHVSAYKNRKRPEYRAMLEAIKAGTYNAVVVWHLDRLHRHPKELEEFFEICDAAGVRDLASVTGDVDLATDDGRFMARIMGAVSRKSSDDMARRIRRKHLELAETGAVVGGARPFGYEKDRKTICTAEAKLVREAADRVLAGSSLRAVVADWKARGITRPSDQSTLRRILLNPRIAGLRAVGFRARHRPGELLSTGAWTPILDEITWRRVKAVLEDPTRDRPHGTGARRYLLSGFMFCQRCGTRMTSSSTKGKRYYRCSSGPETGGCGGVRVVADPLEELVARQAWRALSNPEITRRSERRDTTAEESSLCSERDELVTRLDDLAKLWAVGERTLEEWETARSALAGRQREVERRLQQLRQSRVIEAAVDGAGGVEGRWPALDLHRQRAVLAAVIERVEIGPAVTPGRVFDGRRVSVVWRSTD